MMKKTYTSPAIEIVNLSENDILLFSKIGVENGVFDTIIFGDEFK